MRNQNWKDRDAFEPRDKTRVRGGWKDERNTARRVKAVKRGEFVGMRIARAKGEN